MKFAYKSYGSGYKRPIIPIELMHKGVTVPYEVLVDSGADMCVFDAEIAEILEIDFSTCDVAEVVSATGDVQHIYICEIQLGIGQIKFKTKVGFLKNIVKNGYGVVGQKGFFQNFTVKFDYSQSIIEIKPLK